MVFRRVLRAAVVAVLVATSLSSSGSAAGGSSLDDGSFRPPPNDDFAAAQTLPLGQSVPGTTQDATREGDDPGLSCGSAQDEGPSVWYRIVVSTTGVVSITTGGTRRTAVYRGPSLTALTEVACGLGGVAATGAAGDVLMVAVADSSWGDDAAFEISATWRALVPPSNDRFGDAEVLRAGTWDLATRDSSIEPGEPRGTCTAARRGTVWYRVTPAEATRLNIATPDRGITLFEGTDLASLRQVGCADRQLAHSLEPGRAYALAIDADPFDDAVSSMTVELDLAPPNDRVADAAPLTAGRPVTGTTSLAGYSDGEPRSRCDEGSDASVWYRFTAPRDGMAILEAEPSDFEHVTVAVFADGLGEELVCGAGPARVTIVGGRDYVVQVASEPSWWPTYSKAFTLYLEVVDGPSGDRFADAIAVPFPTPDGEPFPLAADDASRESGEPLTCLGEQGTTWYRFESGADHDGLGTVEAGWWSQVAVFEGEPGSRLSELRPLACGDAPEFGVSPGRSYWVAVGETWGTSDLRLTHRPSPANDDLDDAGPAVSDDPVGVVGTAVDATDEYGEPVCGHGGSVWYRYTAPADGRASFSVLSDVNHAVGVYLGDDPARLTPLRCGDLPVHEAETVTVPVAAGRSYAVRVAMTETAAEGSFRLQTTFVAGARPVNDDVAAATPLLAGRAVDGTIDGATVEHREPDHDCPLLSATVAVPTDDLEGAVDDPARVPVNEGRGPGSVWYRFDAEETGLVRLRLANDAELGFSVYRGEELGSLQQVTCRDRRLAGRDEVADLQVRPGTYWVAVDDRDTARGEPAVAQGFTLSLQRLTSVPTNDHFASAPLIGFDAEVAGDTARATLEPGEPEHDCRLAGRAQTHSVWYDLGTAPSDGRLTALLAAEADQSVAVYEGGSLDTLHRVQCVGVPLTDEDTIVTSLRAGSRYVVAVLTDDDHTSRFDLDLSFVPAEGPANDDAEEAGPLVLDEPVVASTAGATVEPGESPYCGSGGSIWYRVDAPADGRLRLEVEAGALATFATFTEETGGRLAPHTCSEGDDPSFVRAEINGETFSVDGSAATVNTVHVIPVRDGQTYLLAVKSPAVADVHAEAAALFTPSFLAYAPNDSLGDETAEPLSTDPLAPNTGDLRAAQTPGVEDDDLPGYRCSYDARPAGSLWYRYRPSADGMLELRLDAGASLGGDGVHLQVYSGPNPSALRHEGCFFTYGRAIGPIPSESLEVVGGRTYWLRVSAGSVDDEGPFTLGGTFAPAPADDDLRAMPPFTLSPLAPAHAWTGSLAGATREWKEQPLCSHPASTWRAFRVASAGVALVSMSAPEGARLALWRARTATPRPTALNPVTCHEVTAVVDDSATGVDLGAGSSAATITVDPGSVYFVAVSGSPRVWGGDFAVEVAWAPAPIGTEWSVDDVTVTEPVGAGQATASFTVSLARPATSPMTMRYEVEGVTATVGHDVSAGTGEVHIPIGATSARIDLDVPADGIDEEDESFLVHLRPTSAQVVRDGTGVGTIVDGDPTPLVRIDDAEVAEGAGDAAFTVTLDRPSSRTVRVAWRTFDGTATAKQDYVGGSGVLTLPPGTTIARLRVPIIDDVRAERDETFRLVLSDPVHAEVAGGTTTATGTIVDDDGRRPR